MPILRAEPSRFPSDLFDGTHPESDTGRLWYMVHTRPRQEKALARELRRSRIPHYLPLINRRRYVRGRVMTSALPLFPGYLALYADPEERLTTLTTGRVVVPLDVHDQNGLWRDLRQISRLTETSAEVIPILRYTPGTKVRIEKGPLAGFEGVVLRSAAGQRFVVQVDFLQQGASVLLDDFVLNKAG